MRYKRFGFLNPMLFLLALFPILTAAQSDYADTLKVAGANSEHLSRYLTFYVDSTSRKSISEISRSLEKKEFDHWELNTTLNLGLNSYPLWLHLRVKNDLPFEQNYWWSFYSHADSVYVYQKENNYWKATDTVAYGTPLAERNVKVRFSATELVLQGGEYREVLVKLVNYRHTQNAITDFTTPEHNLMWEKKFYWSVGFFIGSFVLISIISFFISLVLRQKMFLLYGLYLLLITSMFLMEELMTPVASNNILFYVLTHIHSLPVAIVALGIHYRILHYILNIRRKNKKVVQRITLLNDITLGFGIVFMLLYFFFRDHLKHGSGMYLILWPMGIVAVFLIMALTFVMCMASIRNRKQTIPVIFMSFLVLYFNPAGYFLNYAGIVNYYKITYPNYFYWIVCLEFIVLGCVLAWRHRKTERNNYELLQQQVEQEERAFARELQIQEQERRQIARDLHDDLGTTLSAIKLIITNSYTNDTALVNMITKANTDLRHFFNKLNDEDLGEQGVFTTLQHKTQDLNSIGKVALEFIGVGEEQHIPSAMRLPVIRIAAELLSNVLKHSKASDATLQLIADTDQLQIIMEDNGKGFDINTPRNGMGLDNIYERTQRWNGNVHISSGKTGTAIIITFPTAKTKEK